MAFVELFLLVSLCALIIYSLLEWRRYREHLKPFNRSEPEWSVLEMIKLLRIPDLAKQNSEIIRKVHTVQTPFVKFFLPNLPFLVISDPKDVLTILTDRRSQARPFFYKFSGSDVALINSPAEIWKAHKKILNASYGYNLMRIQVKMVKEKVDIMLNKLDNLETEGCNDLQAHLRVLSASIIGTSVAEMDMDGDSKGMQTLLESFSRVGEKIEKSTFAPWVFFTIYNKDSEFNQAFQMRAQALNDVFAPIIKSKIKFLDTLTEEELRVLPRTVLNQLAYNLKEGKIGYQEIIEELQFNVMAGVETVTATLMFTLILLALHPNVHKKLVDELKSLFVTRDMDMDYECIKHLTYMDCVIKEAIRLLALVPVIAREAQEDMTLENFTVPRGTIILISLLSMSRDKKVWGADADKFVPERFEMKIEHPYLFFSAGPKSCPGKVYTDLVLKAILSLLLINFVPETKLTCMEDIILKYAFIFRVTNESPVQLRKRVGFYAEE